MALPDPQKVTTTGNMSAALESILGTFGVKPADTRDNLSAVVEDSVSGAGLVATVVEVRWGTLVREADPHNAELLKWQTDALLAAIEAALPGEVTAIQVRTRRSS